MGFAYFAATKFVGYTAFAHFVLNRKVMLSERDSRAPNVWLAGGLRTAIGVSLGALAGVLFWKLPHVIPDRYFDDGLFFLYLIPFRIFEWWVLLRTVYRGYDFREAHWKLIVKGICVSYALDAIGIITAMVLPGGFWVC